MRHFLLFLLFCASFCFGQDSLQTKTFRKNQRRIDLNYSGMGALLFQPNLGKGALIDQNWYGIDLISDIFQFRFAVGSSNKIQPKPNSLYNYDYPIGNYGLDHGYMFSVGANAPLGFLSVGAYHSPTNQFRGHPTLGIHLGNYHFTDRSSSAIQANLPFISLAPGYRLRMPYVTFEVSLDMRAGLAIHDGDEFYSGLGIAPMFTLRFDAFKGLLNPSMVSVPASQVTLSNIESNTVYERSTYSGSYRVDHYTTTTTADVNVSNFNVGVQDIGPNFGIGPKYSFMSPRKSTVTNLGFMLGVAAEGRAASLDIGLTLEGGTLGHGSSLEEKDEEKSRRKLNPSKSDPAGTLNNVNLFLSMGFDISSLFLAPFGIAIDKKEATSFLSVSAGFLVGGHVPFNQQYDAGFDLSKINTAISQNNLTVRKNKFVDPSDISPGFLGGWYFAIHAGATSFKITNYRLYGAPFASTSMISMAWKFPIVYDK